MQRELALVFSLKAFSREVNKQLRCMMDASHWGHLKDHDKCAVEQALVF